MPAAGISHGCRSGRGDEERASPRRCAGPCRRVGPRAGEASLEVATARTFVWELSLGFPERRDELNHSADDRASESFNSAGLGLGCPPYAAGTCT
jgi:hypothetical protein